MGWLRNAANDGPGQIHTIIGNVLPAVGLTYECFYTRVVAGSNFDPDNPTDVSPTETVFSVQGFVDEDMARYRDAGVLTKGERVFALTQKSCIAANLALLAGVVEHKGDKVSARGYTSVVVEVAQDPAQALWLLGAVGQKPQGALVADDILLESGGFLLLE